ncbi:cysteine hydrolase [bacterium]|nr:cysteine hydrolase [bacterium]
MTMRQPYIDEANRDGKVAEWLAAIHRNGRERGPAFDMASAALLVLDMQRYFLDPESHAFVPGSPLVQRSVEQLAEKFRASGRPVIFTRHVDAKGVESPMSSWWKDTLRSDDPRSQIEPSLLADMDWVLVKHTYDAFLGTDLEQRLRDAGVKQLVGCGVVTHLCVETTLRSAFCRGFPIFLPSDATASFSETHHRATLLNLSHGFARIADVSELLEESA